MEEIAISKFKATCLAVLARVRSTSQPILVTRFGVPVAEIVAPRASGPRKRLLGAMAGTATIHGDIVGPVVDPEEWEALRS
jgi:antitoxin (DNA-binding transcriptional repressor) of toxin-antitoxin stability system